MSDVNPFQSFFISFVPYRHFYYFEQYYFRSIFPRYSFRNLFIVLFNLSSILFFQILLHK